MDFLLELNGQGQAQLLVQRYYDCSLYSAIGGYNFQTVESLTLFSRNQMEENLQPDTTAFDTVSRAMNNIAVTLNQQGDRVGSIHLPVGRLNEGNANPDRENFDSNADYCFAENAVELRIPWQLLNFVDPSCCRILDDFRANQYQRTGLEIEKIHAAVYYPDQAEATQFGVYPLESWDMPRYHERLKDAYYVLQEIYGEAGAQ